MLMVKKRERDCLENKLRIQLSRGIKKYDTVVSLEDIKKEMEEPSRIVARILPSEKDKLI